MDLLFWTTPFDFNPNIISFTQNFFYILFFMEYNDDFQLVGLETQLLNSDSNFSSLNYKHNTKTQKNPKTKNSQKNNHTFYTNDLDDSNTIDEQEHIREPSNEEDENMLNYIQHNI